MIVFHGSTQIIEKPDVFHSIRNLDFGKGFYVTNVREQAEIWARRKAHYWDPGKAIVNIYEFNICESLKILDFKEDDEAWIDFVCACRNGSEQYQSFDIIMGKVADDKVFRVVSMYQRGIWDKHRAFQEMKAYSQYHQMTFVTQEAIDMCLSFTDSYEISEGKL